ncbi:MAG: dihydroxy-acid dehydratase [Syntrophales bacterium]|nr:dihydroxy-acid dehydratase [Syntrophales bacterium]
MNPHRGLPEDITEAYYRGLMHSVGYRRKDLDKPQIVVVNSWTDVNPGHQPLRELAMRVKEGIWAGGCPRVSAEPYRKTVGSADAGAIWL